MVDSLSDVYRRCLDIIVERLVDIANDVLWLGLEGIRKLGLNNIHRLIGDDVHRIYQKGQPVLDGCGEPVSGGRNGLGVCVGVASEGVRGQGVIDRDQGRGDHWNGVKASEDCDL